MDEHLCNNENEGEECPICLDNLNSKNTKTLPCNHKFHKLCLDTWLKRKNICPLCRFPLAYIYKCKYLKNSFFNYDITINDDHILFKNIIYSNKYIYKKIRSISYKGNIFNINYYKNNKFILKSFKFKNKLICENFFKIISNKFELNV